MICCQQIAALVPLVEEEVNAYDRTDGNICRTLKHDNMTLLIGQICSC